MNCDDIFVIQTEKLHKILAAKFEDTVIKSYPVIACCYPVVQLSALKHLTGVLFFF